MDIDKEPNPIVNEEKPVWAQVMMDMQERNDRGVKEYGTPLQPFNGRNALKDMYQEDLDRTVYLKQHLIEQESERLIIEEIIKVLRHAPLTTKLQLIVANELQFILDKRRDVS